MIIQELLSSQKHLTKAQFIQNRKEKFGTLCQAPFTTMNFNQGGRITVCCANRDYAVGFYPQRSLMDIWNGEELKKLRDEMDKFSFELGCQQCSLMLDSANYKTLKIKHYDTEDSTLSEGFDDSYRKLKYPYRLDFELSNKCNLECIMCTGVYSSSIRKNRENREPLPEIYETDEFFEELKPFLLNAKRINFFGGEPFLIGTYYKIFDFLLEQKSQTLCYIQTNGTIYNDKIGRYLENLNINLSVSLDAATKEIYEKIRRNAQYDRVISNIEKFREALDKNNKQFFISPIVCTENLFDLKNILDLANKYKAKLYFHHLEYPLMLNLRYADKTSLQQALSHYYSIDAQEYSDSSSGYNFNAFLDALKYVKFCVLNHEKNNPSAIYLVDFLRVNYTERYNIAQKVIQEYNLDEKKVHKLYAMNEQYCIELFRDEPMDTFLRTITGMAIGDAHLLK